MPRVVAVSDSNFTADECVDGEGKPLLASNSAIERDERQHALAPLPDRIFAIRQVPHWDVPVFLVINDRSGARADGCQESRMKRRARR